jgi:hypothetical protein
MRLLDKHTFRYCLLEMLMIYKKITKPGIFDFLNNNILQPMIEMSKLSSLKFQKSSLFYQGNASVSP